MIPRAFVLVRQQADPARESHDQSSTSRAATVVGRSSPEERAQVATTRAPAPRSTTAGWHSAYHSGLGSGGDALHGRVRTAARLGHGTTGPRAAGPRGRAGGATSCRQRQCGSGSTVVCVESHRRDDRKVHLTARRCGWMCLRRCRRRPLGYRPVTPREPSVFRTVHDVLHDSRRRRLPAGLLGDGAPLPRRSHLERGGRCGRSRRPVLRPASGVDREHRRDLPGPRGGAGVDP